MTEIEALRTAHSKTYDLGDGTYQTVIEPRSVHYQEGYPPPAGGAGPWLPIDAQVASLASGTNVVDSSGAPLRLEIRRADRMLVFSAYGETVTLKAVNPAGSPALAVDADRRGLKVANLWTNVDFYLAHRGTLVKSQLVMKSANAPDTVQFAVTRTGDKVLRVHDPVAWDAAGLPVGVRHDLSGGILSVVWDKGALSGKRIWTYPITIDPTISAEGNDVSLFHDRDWDEDDVSDKVLVKFDISSIPDNAIITAATCDLYLTTTGATVTCKRAQSQTWTEVSAVSTLDAIVLGALLSSRTGAQQTLNAYNAWNIRKGDNTDGLEADLVGANQYFTACFEYGGTTVDAADNSASLVLGVRGGGGWEFRANSSEAASNRPRLTITYTLPKTAQDSGTGTETSAVAKTESKAGADAGAGTEAGALAAGLPQADSGTVAEGVTLAADAGVSEAGAGTEVAALAADATGAESGAGGEASELLAAGAPADSGAAAEASSVFLVPEPPQPTSGDDLFLAAIIRRRRR